MRFDELPQIINVLPRHMRADRFRARTISATRITDYASRSPTYHARTHRRPRISGGWPRSNWASGGHRVATRLPTTSADLDYIRFAPSDRPRSVDLSAHRRDGLAHARGLMRLSRVGDGTAVGSTQRPQTGPKISHASKKTRSAGTAGPFNHSDRRGRPARLGNTRRRLFAASFPGVQPRFFGAGSSWPSRSRRPRWSRQPAGSPMVPCASCLTEENSRPKIFPSTAAISARSYP